MEIVNLKDYKGEYLFDCYNETVIPADDVDYIKELSKENHIFYGAREEKVFDKNSDYLIREMVEDFAYNNGYEDMELIIDYESEEFQEVISAFNKWIESLGDTNNIYYKNENILIKVGE